MYGIRGPRRWYITLLLAVLLAGAALAVFGLQRVVSAQGGAPEVSLNTPVGFPVDI